MINNDNIYTQNTICPKCGEYSLNEQFKIRHNIKDEIKNLRIKIDIFNNSIILITYK